MKLIGRIVCFFKGHKRRVYFRDGAHRNGVLCSIYACPRCLGNEHRYRIKAKPAEGNNGTPTDGSAHFQEAT